MQWGLFFLVTAIAYIGISLFSQLSGGSSASAWQAFISAIRPAPLAVMVLANMFFALGIYYGFVVTRYALPLALAVGVLVSFTYSVLVFGAQISALKLLGIVLILAGILLLGA